MAYDFDEKVKLFFEAIGKSAKMVLATSLNDIVSARTMSVIIHNGGFYFQTDIFLRKYNQIIQNENVALCVDNIQIEGICKELGAPKDHKDFCEHFKKAFPGSFQAYSMLENERVFEVVPSFIQRWIYVDKVPHIETFDFKTRTYQKEAYIGK